MDEHSYEVVVAGGGAAGLSAALVLGRARRRTLLVDAGGQSNRAAHAMGGVLGQDGVAPGAFYTAARAELARYPAVEVRDGEVAGGARDGDGFALELGDGTTVRAEQVVLATGMAYEAPALEGVAERWGGSVFHCPFCHGWEVHGRPLAVFSPSGGGAEKAVLLRAWSDDVTLLTDGPADLDPEAAARLEAAGVEVDERPLAALRGPGAELEELVFADGSARACGGLLVGVTLRQRSALAAQLGAQTHSTPLSDEVLVVDQIGRTSVPGVYAAGDVTGVMPAVPTAIAAGQAVAAAVVRELTLRMAGAGVPAVS